MEVGKALIELGQLKLGRILSLQEMGTVGHEAAEEFLLQPLGELREQAGSQNFGGLGGALFGKEGALFPIGGVNAVGEFAEACARHVGMVVAHEGGGEGWWAEEPGAVADGRR